MVASLPLLTPKAREGGRTAHLERVTAKSIGAEGMWAERFIQRLPTADDRVAPVGVTEADTCLHAEAPDGLETPLATEAGKVDFRFRGVENVRVSSKSCSKAWNRVSRSTPKLKCMFIINLNSCTRTIISRMSITGTTSSGWRGVVVVTAVPMVRRRNRVVIGWAFGGRRKRTPLEVFFLSLNA
ncbi:hypothetical protein ACFX11_026797 [Malus domestica]